LGHLSLQRTCVSGAGGSIYLRGQAIMIGEMLMQCLSEVAFPEADS
jgi:hypothetical protein